MSDYRVYYVRGSFHDVKEAVSAEDRSVLEMSRPYSTNCMVASSDLKELWYFSIGMDCAPPSFLISNRRTRTLILNFVISGGGMIQTEEGTRTFKKGDVYYTPPYFKHSLVSDSREPWKTVWLVVGGTYAQKILQRLRMLSVSENDFLCFKSPETVWALAENILFNYDCGQNIAGYVRGVVELFLSYVYNPRDNGCSLADKELTSAAIRLIQNDLSCATVESTAKKLYVSRQHLTKVFTKVAKVSPQKFITDSRLELANYMLIYTDSTLSEIADAVGYRHYNGLETAFKKKYGCSPLRFRREWKNNDKMP